MIYVDTNILIAYINPKDSLHDRSVRLIEEYRDKNLIISELVLVELYSVFSRTMKLSNTEIKALARYTVKKTGVRILPTNYDKVYALAKQYANILKLKTLDLLHVATAKTLSTEGIITLDKDIINKKGIIHNNLNLKVYF